MADEIVSDATFGQNKGDEEEPIIVAQRFLNIFRQLHIFSAERREVFNKMILEQPPAVQVLFKNLPGGSILQDYIDELQGKTYCFVQVVSEPIGGTDLKPESSGYT